jgi:hypothetical protein
MVSWFSANEVICKVANVWSSVIGGTSAARFLGLNAANRPLQMLFVVCTPIASFVSLVSSHLQNLSHMHFGP